jgi:hypothetical protein
MGEFTVVKAKRKAVPALISLSGTSGSGKTLSGLLMAAGLAGSGKVGMIDAENGRGTLYEDDPLVRAALPGGYDYVPITPPYSPARYVEAIRAMEAAGVDVCLIDSTSHEWEGEGGCSDIAETKKLKGMPNWALAKREHKKFLAYCLSSRMHLIFCLRAREKTVIVKDENGKEQFVPKGIQPVAEKNFVFEMLLSLSFDDGTHHYQGVKVPKMLAGIVKGGELITKAHGEAIRQWLEGGAVLAPGELLQKRARSAAECGMKEYSALFGALPADQKRILADTTHADNKAIAESVDLDAEMESFEQRFGGRFFDVIGNHGAGNWAEVSKADRSKVAAAVRESLKEAA